MGNTLFIIAVPIGNLKEITILAKEKLSELKTIFCEDTRVTKSLLQKLDILNNQKLYCVNKFKESMMFESVLKELNNNDCGLVSDAGYPVISDPGYFLIKKIRELSYKVQVINGPCAFIHAIVMSGIDSRKIFWANFLTKKELKRRSELEELLPIHEMSTIVFYESANFLKKSLLIIKMVFGDIKIAVCKELSKLHENFYFDFADNLSNLITFKGEFVVIIPRKNKILEANIDVSLAEIHEHKINKNCTLREAIKHINNSTYSSSDLYKEYIKKYEH